VRWGDLDIVRCCAIAGQIAKYELYSSPWRHHGNDAELRHFKLLFAGKLRNWELAAYELEQIKESFRDAATLYPGIPITDMTIVVDPVQQLGQAIQKKDPKKFSAAFTELTAACNGCHQAIGRGFIVIQVPTSSPFSNQIFEPAAKR
jgi:hypothetical protein